MEASYQLPTANRRTVIGEKGCGRDIGNSRCDRKEWGIPARSAARILAWVPVGFLEPVSLWSNEGARSADKILAWEPVGFEAELKGSLLI
jgi:hypothetical protein